MHHASALLLRAAHPNRMVSVDVPASGSSSSAISGLIETAPDSISQAAGPHATLAPMELRVAPLTPDLWPAFEELFEGGSACKRCWCMYWRIGSAYHKR